MRAAHIIAQDLRLFSDLKRCLIRIDFTTALITNFSRYTSRTVVRFILMHVDLVDK